MLTEESSASEDTKEATLPEEGQDHPVYRPRGSATRRGDTVGRLWKRRFPCRMESLAPIRDFVQEVAGHTELEAEAVYNLRVAVSEACANAIEHSTACSDLFLTLRLDQEELVVRLWHAGDFRIRPGRSDGRHRGMGLPFMVLLTDSLRIARDPQGGTEVEISLRLPG